MSVVLDNVEGFVGLEIIFSFLFAYSNSMINFPITISYCFLSSFLKCQETDIPDIALGSL